MPYIKPQFHAATAVKKFAVTWRAVYLLITSDRGMIESAKTLLKPY